MVCKNVVVEFGESGSGCQLLALELKSGYLLGLIVSFHGDAVGVGIGGSEKASGNVRGSEVSGVRIYWRDLGGAIASVAASERLSRSEAVAGDEGVVANAA